MHHAGEMREYTIKETTRESWGEGLVAVPVGENVDVDVRLESVHEGILVTGDVATAFTGICGRCLQAIDEPLQVDFQELFAYPGTEAADLLSLPFQPVCEPDCPGLDPETGEKLAIDSDAHPEEAHDPRWAALGKFTTDPGTGEDGTGPAPR
mgnify:CR=1 FL=1